VEPRQRPARRVVDHHPQHAPGPATLEPVVVAPVHLHQRAQARPPRPPAPVLPTLPPTLPKPTRPRQRRQRVRADLDPVIRRQLLARQRRAALRLRSG
jgi:hypothetical protein